MKRIFSLVIILGALALGIAQPAAAQDTSAAGWIPADFAGFVRVDFANAQMTLNNLNLSLFVASVLQPARVTFEAVLSYDDFFPLDSFDVEGGSFSRNVLPWLHGAVILAYADLDAQFHANASNTVVILPAQDSFQAASYFNTIIRGQDLLERETYRGVSIYLGDKIDFAFTPSAVLIGRVEYLRAIIDAQAGETPALSADPIYQQVSAALPADDLVFGYLRAPAAVRALGVLTSGGNAADPIFAALVESLEGLGDASAPERLLLGGALDGIGVSLIYDQVSRTMHAEAVLHTTDAPYESDAVFNTSVLDLIPRSAMIVQSGADASSAAVSALHLLPLLNFAGRAVSAFPVMPSEALLALTPPTGEDVTLAVGAFLDAVQPVVDVQDDLLNKLEGSYSLALLPRPNNPLPGLNMPFDLLLVVQTPDADAAAGVQASASRLLEIFTTLLEDEELSSRNFSTLRDAATGEALVRVGTVDNLVVVGTGAAAQQALDAWRGDNRLVRQDRWQALNHDDAIPYIYVDVTAYYNTFLPTLGGSAVLPVSQLGIHSRYLGDNLFKLDVLVTLRL